MIVLDNKTGLQDKDVFVLAERENNSKRRNLLVNYRQAKHIPAIPSEAYSMFCMLGDQIKGYVNNRNCLVIGFAETATAIGAVVSQCIGSGCVYIHTTREEIPNDYLISDFSEEHSHATEQRLFSSEKNAVFNGIEAIIFVDDELTTGKTIINFIDTLRHKVDDSCKYYAASIINGMSDENINTFESNGIKPIWLIRTSDTLEDLNKDMSINQCSDVIPKVSDSDFMIIYPSGFVNPRLSCSISLYNEACEIMCDNVYNSISEQIKKCRSIDVIGTEECMFPAIKFGGYLESLGYTVRSHSTTRSPIVPSDTPDYPLSERCRLHSFYERERTTYIYNLYSCDMTVLITDTDYLNMNTVREFSSVLKSKMNIFVHWRR